MEAVSLKKTPLVKKVGFRCGGAVKRAMCEWGSFMMVAPVSKIEYHDGSSSEVGSRIDEQAQY
jgi:hypothetical protein